MANSSFTNKLLGLQSNLMSFAYQLTSNRETAEDLVQDTTLKVLDNESKYVDNVNFKGWVFTIMRNIFITTAGRKNIMRKKQDVTMFHAFIGFVTKTQQI